MILANDNVTVGIVDQATMLLTEEHEVCLWVPTSEWTFFEAGTAFVGGAMSMRIIHYFMMFVFIIFTMLRRRSTQRWVPKGKDPCKP